MVQYWSLVEFVKNRNMVEEQSIISIESQLYYNYVGKHLYIFDEDEEFESCFVPNDKFFDIMERIVNRDYDKLTKVVDGKFEAYMSRDFLYDSSPTSLLIFLCGGGDKVIIELNLFDERGCGDIVMKFDEFEEFYHKLKQHYDEFECGAMIRKTSEQPFEASSGQEATPFMARWITEKFKKYLYDNESKIKPNLYNKIPDKMNRFGLNDIRDILVTMFVDKNDDNPFSEKYDTLMTDDVKNQIIIPFLSKKNETLYFDVIIKTDALHGSLDLHECNMLLANDLITFNQYVDKLKQFGYDVDTKPYEKDGQVFANINIVKGKAFGGKVMNHICDLRFYKRPYGNCVYSSDVISKEDVEKFLTMLA